MRKPNSVREPIQVYLDDTERSWLDAMAATEGVSRSELLRRSVRQYRATRDEAQSPMLRLLHEAELGVGETPNSEDAARRHDEVLEEAYTYVVPKPATTRRRRTP